ncbi:ATP-binding protein [Inhella gelatinilytica]|uniref:histidine kinase n=1 Tax=Inhella gelatinilytica TaxID=2795030 RepID=A0A931IVS8_9BURK|nr:ATP-binding protein [Inhella gelatinilytica]MBH9551909.1 sensor histidine kinase N-terminal domain-containing protein [Inhella gelatinilytica]
MTAPAPRAPSLQRRLLLSLLGGLVTTVVVLGLLSAGTMWGELDEQLDEQLVQTADLLLQIGAQVSGPSLQIGAPREEAHAQLFQVVRQGQVLIRSAHAPHEALWPSAPPGFSARTWNGSDWRVYTVHGEGLSVWVADTQAQRLHWLAEAFESWPVIWPTAFAVLCGLLVLGLRRVLEPLRAVEAEVARRQPGSLQPLQTDPLPRELEPLVQALNALLARVHQTLSRERQFTADAAHELRTPIAALRVQAQVAQGATDDAERSEALNAVLAGCERAAHLVDQLLALARLDEDPAEPAVALPLVDVAALARDVLAELLSVHPQRADDVQLNAPEGGVPVTTDPLWARLLLRNLLDNALRYSPPGAPVHLTVNPTGLRVDDGGPGLPPDTWTELGQQRFWRGSAATGSGTGLGWAIVRRCAHHVGWAVEVDQSPLGGLGVRVGFAPPR